MSHSTVEIWEHFNQEIRGFVARRVDDPYDVEDLVQDIFIKIHTHIDSLADDQRLAPWLYRIARNTVTDYYRTRHPAGELSEALAVETGDLDREPDTFQRLAAGLQEMIAGLPDKYRQAVYLAEIQGLSQQDLAELNGISLSGAKSRVQRGREMLRQSLLDCCHFEFDLRNHVIETVPRQDCCERCSR
jgi:RNA polymerase sigma-70 factor (ECF subfamily)